MNEDMQTWVNQGVFFKKYSGAIVAVLYVGLMQISSQSKLRKNERVYKIFISLYFHEIKNNVVQFYD